MSCIDIPVAQAHDIIDLNTAVLIHNEIYNLTLKNIETKDAHEVDVVCEKLYLIAFIIYSINCFK